MIPPASILASFSLLALSICFAWVRPVALPNGTRIPLWAPTLIAAIACGLWAGNLSWPAVVALGLFAWVASLCAHENQISAIRGVAFLALFVMVGLLATHNMPGFRNPRLLHDFQFSPDAVPYTQHANFDKGAAGLILLVFFCARVASRDAWRGMHTRTLPYAIATCACVIGAGLLLGYSRPDFKLPAYAPIFLATNLFFTCVAEEALFRGVLQHGLSRLLSWRGFAHAGWMALIAVSLLFGLVHTGGGIGYVVLATLAGMGYGYAFLRTQCIESAILVHFCVNAVHFIGFTYPRLA